MPQTARPRDAFPREPMPFDRIAAHGLPVSVERQQAHVRIVPDITVAVMRVAFLVIDRRARTCML